MLKSGEGPGKAELLAQAAGAAANSVLGLGLAALGFRPASGIAIIQTNVLCEEPQILPRSSGFQGFGPLLRVWVFEFPGGIIARLSSEARAGWSGQQLQRFAPTLYKNFLADAERCLVFGLRAVRGVHASLGLQASARLHGYMVRTGPKSAGTLHWPW